MSDQPFGDIPLFQELQRLLSSGGGPVNKEIASQIAKAQLGASGPAPARARETVFADDVRGAEMLLAGYTRLSVVEPARATLITPHRWVEETLTGWDWLFEAFAASFSRTMGERGEGEGAAAMLGPVIPLLMGLQVGTLVGQLAGDSLGRYDLPIPRDDDGRLFLVEQNADAVAKDYDFDHADFTRWLAIRETSKDLIFTNAPWALKYLRAAFRELVESIEVDMGEIETLLAGLQTGGMEAMSELAPGGVMPVVETERHRIALERLRSFITLFEGYSAHAGGAVAGEVVPTAARIEEGMSRRAASPSEGKAALSSVLGLSFDKQSVARGKTFCDAVTSLHGIQALNQVWGAPDNLPNAEELRDPFAWIERVLEPDRS